MNDIQKARDVLKKWRDGATPGPWTMKSDWPYPGRMVVSYETGGKFVTGHVVGGRVPEITAPLIVGTAGNPDLLDAIDGLLRDWVTAGPHLASNHPMKRIAAAIIAADERMQQ